MRGTDTDVESASQFVASLSRLSGDDLRAIAASLESDTLTDEVDWWRATIAIDKLLRHVRHTRQAARAATDAVHAVRDAATRAGIALPDDDMTRVARAAADVARGLVAGLPARPVVRLLLEHWAPASAVV
jgi:hypothetical protein